jgi:hypothetical protein
MPRLIFWSFAACPPLQTVSTILITPNCFSLIFWKVETAVAERAETAT